MSISKIIIHQFVNWNVHFETKHVYIENFECSFRKLLFTSLFIEV